MTPEEKAELSSPKLFLFCMPQLRSLIPKILHGTKDSEPTTKTGFSLAEGKIGIRNPVFSFVLFLRGILAVRLKGATPPR